MKTKLRPRYYCDHCGKSGGSAHHMKRHESGCTLNPDRICKMCDVGGLAQKSFGDLVAALGRDLENADQESEAPPVPHQLEQASEGCPACMLTAIRAVGMHVCFDFRDQCEQFWKAVNEDRGDSSTINLRTLM